MVTNKQTAVQWFMDELEKKGNAVTDHTKLTMTITIPLYDMSKLYRDAIKMEKEQIENSYTKGQESMQYKFPLSSEAYYNETYSNNTITNV